MVLPHLLPPIPPRSLPRAQKNPLLLTLQSDENIFADPILDDKLTLRFSAYNTKEEFNLVNKFSKRVEHPYFDTSTGGKPFMLSCRGLVCLSSWTFNCPPILVCNPSTQELISLPPTERPIHCMGFGYAASSREFKVAGFFSGGKKSPCWVFTLGTSSWREVKTPPFNVYLGTAPFLHQALHFLTCISDGVKETNHIAVFDINTEEYREAISLPEFSHGGTAVTFRFLRLTKLGGCLCLTFDSRELREPLEVWLLKDYCNGEWIKRYTIHVISAYPTPCFIFGAYLTDTMGDESILLNCSDEDGVKLLCYDPQDGTATLKKDKEWGATFYVESFYPLLSR